MKIAIQAADLDYARIDGTRVYIYNLLKYFGKIDSESNFLIYHWGKFNPELVPPNFHNYKIKKIRAPFFWTQTRFAWEIWKEKPDVLWMPMHNIPLVRRRGLKVFVTCHDLAFKYFPNYFTRRDLQKLNFLGDQAFCQADRIITVSESTKKDILNFFPDISEEKIKVIHHGFDSELFAQARNLEVEKKLKSHFKIKGNYIFYSGALQPRKNLKTLVEAFEILKAKKTEASSVKLVLGGEKAWLWQALIKKVRNSPAQADIIMPGKLRFWDLGHLLRGASVYVYPSLYEGFGLPLLEGMAARVPVIAANNSSLPEAGGNAALYFNANDPVELAEKIEKVLTDENLRQELIRKGTEQIKKFSWEKCARTTLDYLKS